MRNVRQVDQDKKLNFIFGFFQLPMMSLNQSMVEEAIKHIRASVLLIGYT